MSMMSEPDDPRQEMNELLERFRTSDLDDDLRRIGVYIDDYNIVGSEQGVVLSLSCSVGNVAFSQRVQDPEQAGFDDQFRSFEQGAKRDAFLDERERIAKCLEQGIDPFASPPESGEA